MNGEPFDRGFAQRLPAHQGAARFEEGNHRSGCVDAQRSMAYVKRVDCSQFDTEIGVAHIYVLHSPT
jgi:hypothetical protein